MIRPARRSFVPSAAPSRRLTPTSPFLRLLIFITILAVTPLADAEPARLVADLAPGARAVGSEPRLFTAVSDRLVFVARDQAHGEELWSLPRAGGSAPSLLADLCPGECLTLINSFVELDGGLLVAGRSEEIGGALWRIDLESGEVQLLLDPAPGSLRSWVYELTPFDGRVFFAAGSDGPGVELWVTDGTPEGTAQVKDLCAGLCYGNPRLLTVLGDRLLFEASSAQKGPELWISDGTAAGTSELKDLCSSCSAFPVPLGVFDGNLFFRAQGENGFELFVTDGTPAGTVELLDIVPGPLSGTPDVAALLGTKVVVLATSCESDRGCLIESDGTRANTRRVVSPLPGNAAQSICSIESLGTELLLLAAPSCPSAGERQLWATGVDFSHPRLVAENLPGFPRFLAVAGNRAYLRLEQFGRGSELWSTDGTVAGTSLVKDLAPGTADSFPSAAEVIDGRLYFSARSGLGDRELWESDGTGPGTRLLAEIAPNVDSSSPFRLTPAGDRLLLNAGSDLYTSTGLETEILLPGLPLGEAVSGNATAAFLTTTPDGEGQYYVSDGTASGTELKAETEFPAQFLTAGQGVVFFGERGPGQKLWKVAGDSGKELVVDVNPGWTNIDAYPFGARLSPPPPPPIQFPQSLTWAQNRLYFVASETGALDQLWITDGSTAGSRVVKGFPRGSEDVLRDRFELTPLGTRVIFTATSPTSGREPWVSDGTPEGTFELEDIRPGSASSTPTGLTAAGDHVYFFTVREDGGEELWSTDGTRQGTLRVTELVANGEKARFRGESLWTGVRLFFLAETLTHGEELWVSDGTAGGTRMVWDLRPGALGAGIGGFAALGERVIFAADDGHSGHEVWVSDGTPAGTLQVADVEPGRHASSPRNFAVVGEEVFFSAFSSIHGRELFALPLSSFGSACIPSAEVLCLDSGRFAASVRWRDHRTGAQGAAGAVPYAEDTGSFWFFRPENRELLLKVLDGRGVNGHFWVFAGATSDVEYTVTVRDLVTREVFLRTNPAGTFCGFAATNALPASGNATPRTASAEKGLPLPPASQLLGGRFQVMVEWNHPSGGIGGAAAPVSLSDQSSAFWFFRPGNLELLVKMVDGRSVNGRFWFFFGALTNLGYRIHVTDTETGVVKTYENRAGEICGRADVEAF